MDLSNQQIAIVGLGYVGLPLAVEFGKNRPVLGFDINAARIAELQSGQDSTLEVSPEGLATAHQLSFSCDPEDLKACQIFIVTVPTPVDKANRPDLTPLVKASETVGKVLPEGAVVIYESTVYPGATEEVCVPVLEKFSGKQFNVGFYCGYSPERINPGDKVNTLTKIKKITSGSTPEVADAVDALYRSIITAGTHKAEEVGYHPQVILAGRRINDNMARYVARNTIKLMLKNGMDVPRCRIGVLGITFKENCPDIRNSKVADMVREFEAWGATVVLADPWASADEVVHEYGLQLGQVDAANPVDALVVAVGHNEYRQATPADLRALCRGPRPVLADVKSLFDREKAAQAGFTVFRL